MSRNVFLRLHAFFFENFFSFPVSKFMLLWSKVGINPFMQYSFTWAALNTATNDHQQYHKLKVYDQYLVTRTEYLL